MDIQQEIVDLVIHSGEWEMIRGLIAEHELVNDPKSSFTGVVFWSENEHQYALAYSENVMVLKEDGKLKGVTKFDASLLPFGVQSKFRLSSGSNALLEGTL